MSFFFSLSCFRFVAGISLSRNDDRRQEASLFERRSSLSTAPLPSSRSLRPTLLSLSPAGPVGEESRGSISSRYPLLKEKRVSTNFLFFFSLQSSVGSERGKKKRRQALLFLFLFLVGAPAPAPLLLPIPTFSFFNIAKITKRVSGGRRARERKRRRKRTRRREERRLPLSREAVARGSGGSGGARFLFDPDLAAAAAAGERSQTAGGAAAPEPASPRSPGARKPRTCSSPRSFCRARNQKGLRRPLRRSRLRGASPASFGRRPRRGRAPQSRRARRGSRSSAAVADAPTRRPLPPPAPPRCRYRRCLLLLLLRARPRRRRRSQS